MQLRRSLFLAVMLSILLQPLTSFAQNASQSLLNGIWHHTVLIRTIGNQALEPLPLAGDSFVEFKPDGTWTLTAPRYKSAGTYVWLDSERIETTVVESNLLIQIGLVSIKQVRVDASRLNLITVQTAEDSAKYRLPIKPGSPPFPDVMLTSIFSRVSD